MAEVGSLISKDPALSALVLRMANSILFNPSSQRIITLARAVMVLGMERIRTLCYSALVLESTVHARYQEKVLDLLRQSLELASQSQFLAEKVGVPAEPFFLSGLLQQMGQLAFWCAGMDGADEVANLIEQGMSPDQAAVKILGFSFSELNRELLDLWGLQQIRDPGPAGGLDVLEEARLWVKLQTENKSAALEQRVLQLQPLFRQSPQTLLRSLRDNREQTLALIPPQWLQRGSVKPVPQWSQVDPAVQLQVVADMHALPRVGAYLPVLLRTVLEGLCRGGGWDRCAFFVHQEGGWQARLQEGVVANSFPSQLVQTASGVDLARAQPQDVLLRGGQNEGCFHPEIGGLSAALRLQDKVIGVLYVDRELSQRKAEAGSRQAFELFWRQLQMALQLAG